jgi:hypothetical protein
MYGRSSQQAIAPISFPPSTSLPSDFLPCPPSLAHTSIMASVEPANTFCRTEAQSLSIHQRGKFDSSAFEKQKQSVDQSIKSLRSTKTAIGGR